MNPQKRYLYFCIIMVIAAVFLKLLIPKDALIILFLLSFTINSLIGLYFVYSLYEMYILHEKQGSKLSLSKDKLNIKWD